jgi:hypothetical protein
MTIQHTEATLKGYERQRWTELRMVWEVAGEGGKLTCQRHGLVLIGERPCTNQQVL